MDLALTLALISLIIIAIFKFFAVPDDELDDTYKMPDPTQQWVRFGAGSHVTDTKKNKEDESDPRQ